MPQTVILLLAAGAGRRMRGRDKLMEQVGGEPLLLRLARSAVATGCPVIVALPPDSTARRAALEGLPLSVVSVADAAEGMGRSLAGAAAAAPVGAAMLVVLADMPEIGTAEMVRMIEAADTVTPGTILRGATADGRPGHPVLFPASLRKALTDLRGDEGARRLMRAAPVTLVPLPGDAAVTDLDTPEAWEAWRAAQGQGGD